MSHVIVGEVSITYDIAKTVEEHKTRVDSPMGTISQRFEHVIAMNTERGYKLRDWQFTSVPIGVQAGSVSMTSRICETIVATFEK